MPNAIEYLAEQVKELDKIIIEKGYEDYEVQRLLKEWLVEVIFSYNINNDILGGRTLDEYVNSYLDALRKLENITIFQIEDVLKDPTNYFYKEIHFQNSSEEKYIVPYKLKKENDHFVLEEQGDYWLSTSGVFNFDTKKIGLLMSKNVVKTFHHELTHVIQMSSSFNYPCIFPFSFKMKTMLEEGEAEYNRKIISESILDQGIFWDEAEVQVLNYELYFQIYTLLMLAISNQNRFKWLNNEIDLINLSKERKESFANLFAIISLLLAKSDPDIKENNIESHIRMCYMDCQAKLDEYNENLETSKSIETRIVNAQKEIQHLQNLLNDTNLLKEAYIERVSEVKQEIMQEENIELRMALLKELEEETIVEFKSALEREKLEKERNLAYNQNLLTSHSFLEESEIETYQFGKLISTFMHNYVEQKISISELFRLLVEKIEELLLETDTIDLNKKLDFVRSLKELLNKQTPSL